MYKALYRKYRPMTFDDMCGQQHIRSVLQRQCEQGTLSHAYLFCGTRGTGKTTSAKILAKAANCESLINGNPCGVCPSCAAIDAGIATDVLELDAASNNGVDDIRDICDELIYPPSSLKKRVYIIDEVHMLSAGAFNALLKTLEEPPEHVLFILATTELQKIPPTILSRCQRFEFRRIPAADIKERLLLVALKESLELEPKAAELLARLADGAMRDGFSLLESCVAATDGNAITEEVVVRQLGLASDDSIFRIMASAASGDIKTSLAVLEDYYNSAKNLSTLIEDMIYAVRDTLVYRQSGIDSLPASKLSQTEIKSLSGTLSSERLLYIASVLEDTQSRLLRYPFNKKLLCEFAIIRLCDPKLSDSLSSLCARVTEIEKNGISISPVSAEKGNPVSAEKTETASFVQEKQGSKSKPVEQYEKFPELVDLLQNRNPLTSFIAQAFVGLSGDNMIIRTSPVGVSILSTDSNIEIIKNAAYRLDGRKYNVTVVDESTCSAEKPGLINEI